MAGPSPVVTVRGEFRTVRPRPLTDETTGEVRDAFTVLVLTESPGDTDAGGGFAEVYVSPDLAHALDPAPQKGAEVELLCRAYAVTRNYGTAENPKFGKALGLSYVSGSFGNSAAASAPYVSALPA